MDGFRLPRSGSQRTNKVARRAGSHHYPGKLYWLVRSLGQTASSSKQRLWHRFVGTEFAKWPDKGRWQRLYAFSLALLFIGSSVAAILQPLLEKKPYHILNATRMVLPEPNSNLANYIDFDNEKQQFAYNSGYRASLSGDLARAGNGVPRITANFGKEPKDGVSVTDPLQQISISLKPKFRLHDGRQDQNQIFYPLVGKAGFLVYTPQVATVKEDIVLERADKDKMEFEYDLTLPEGLEARLEHDGSIGIYGSELPIYGQVATGSEDDAKLLEQTRNNAEKNQLIFGIPSPVIIETGRTQSVAKAHFELEGSRLKVVAEGLKAASYPLSIDPSVYVQSATQLMRGNNESNVEFDVATEQFKKGTTTGARIDEWADTSDMNSTAWDQGVAAAGGYIYRAGGRTGRIKPRIMDYEVSRQTTDSTTLTLNMPAVRPAGDLYVAFLCHDDAADTVSQTGGGWTEFVDVGEFAAYYKVGTDQGSGSESASYNFTISSTEQSAGVVMRIKDFDITSPVTNQASSGSNATPTYPSITATQEGMLMISAAGVDQDNPESTGFSPAGFEDIVSAHSDNNASVNGCGLFASEYKNPPRSGVATGSATLSTSASDTYGAGSIAIRGLSVTASLLSTVEWAHFNSSNGTIDSPTPGSTGGPCSGWCTNSSYDLPTNTSSTSDGAGKVGMSMVAYNGYLYVMGGYDGTQLKSTVYIAKLGINGEPSLWHPTDPDEADWVYWYKDSGLSGGTAKAYLSAYAYNGRMYVLGGDTNTTANSGATTAVHIADILPNGTLGTWSSGQSLPAQRYGSTVQAYNGYLYVLGGNNNGTMLSTAHYSRLNSNGTMNSWQVAAADGVTAGFTTGRSSHGGVMSGIWGAYLYLAGGCTAVNASGYCTDTATDVQLASINADGTLDAWNTMRGLKNKRFGYSFIAWQDSLYRFGGCEFQDPSSGECYASHEAVQYGNINQDGDASTVSITTATGSGLCQGDDPYDCNLPPGGTGSGQSGQALSSTAIINGFLYVIGGCTTNACTTMSGNTAYVAIDSDGKLKRPPTCSGGTYGSWCVDSTNQISGGVGAAAIAVFGGRIYLVGGQDGSGAKGNIYRNAVNADGSFTGGWSSQTMTSVGATSVSYTFVYARANPSSASSNPGNLYIFGGCSAPATGAGCTSGNNYTQNVFKCNITSSGTVSGCSTSGQLQIGTVTGAINPGLGIHAGAVYANYVYLIGGVADGVADLKTIRYAKFDNSNNVVAVSGSAWIESPNETSVGRRRGTAFGYNGYLYVVGGYDQAVGGTLDDIQFSKINVSDGSISAFQTSAVTINQRWGLGMAVSNSYAYVIGGCKDGNSPTCNANGLDDTVQTFQVYNNDSGAPGGYVTETDLFATDRVGASAAVLNGYLYLAGGCTSATDCTTATDSVQYTALDAYGGVGTWSAGGNLPAVRAWGQLEAAGGTLYYLGGQTSTSTDERGEVYYTTGFSSGSPTWSASAATRGIGDSGSGAQARTKFSSTVWNNRIYVVGGLDSNATATASVYISPQLNSGGNITGNWTTGTSLSVARSSHVTIAYANNLYVYGGRTGSDYLSDSQLTQINTDGSLDSWVYTTSLPSPLAEADGFAVNGYMYLFGGRSSTNDCTPRTLVAPISANTTISSGNNPTGIGEWYETNRRFDQGRYGAAAAYHQGKAYVLGGGCQGIVMQDDFDSDYDSSQWSYTTGMAANTNCQSTSTSNTFSTNDGSTANRAETIAVNVSSGGTVHFKLYIPIADIPTGSPTCYKTESTTSLFTTTTEDAVLEYSNNGGAWTQIGGVYSYNTQDPLKSYSVTIPAGAQGTSTKFRWRLLNAEANDSFALEDVKIIATGSTSLTYTDTRRVQYTPLLSQPQVAIYSRLIDANKDVFPTTWLMNGLDNSIGARWQMSYRSMNDPTVTDANKACGGSAMTAFGQETNFGDVTLGQSETYTVRNGAGTDIACGRYFFMTISIDASRTYGYPDDIARGPTLTDLTLFFKANPGQRLLHGKTFIEGIQQPLDTQPGP